MVKIYGNKNNNLKMRESGDHKGEGKGTELERGTQKLSKTLVIRADDGYLDVYFHIIL